MKNYLENLRLATNKEISILLGGFLIVLLIGKGSENYNLFELGFAGIWSSAIVGFLVETPKMVKGVRQLIRP